MNTTNTDTNNIIGITGRKRHGKDTLSDYLVARHGYRKLSFAEPLKAICKTLFGLTDAQLYGDKKEEIDDYWNVSPRVLYQYIGTDLLRTQMGAIMPHMGDNLWVEIMHKTVMDILRETPTQRIVFADVRFENEVAFVRELGGRMIRVVRGGGGGVNGVGGMRENDTHISETQIDDLVVDISIYNGGTPEDMFCLLEEAL